MKTMAAKEFLLWVAACQHLWEVLIITVHLPLQKIPLHQNYPQNERDTSQQYFQNEIALKYSRSDTHSRRLHKYYHCLEAVD